MVQYFNNPAQQHRRSKYKNQYPTKPYYKGKKKRLDFTNRK